MEFQHTFSLCLSRSFFYLGEECIWDFFLRKGYVVHSLKFLIILPFPPECWGYYSSQQSFSRQTIGKQKTNKQKKTIPVLFHSVSKGLLWSHIYSSGWPEIGYVEQTGLNCLPGFLGTRIKGVIHHFLFTSRRGWGEKNTKQIMYYPLLMLGLFLCTVNLNTGPKV